MSLTSRPQAASHMMRAIVAVAMLLASEVVDAQAALEVYSCEPSNDMDSLTIYEKNLPKSVEGDVVLGFIDDEFLIVDGPATLGEAVLVVQGKDGFQVTSHLSVISTHDVRDVVKHGPLSDGLGKSLLATMGAIASKAAGMHEPTDALGDIVISRDAPCFLVPWEEWRSSKGPLDVQDLVGLLYGIADARMPWKRRELEARLDHLLQDMKATLRFASLPQGDIHVAARLKALDQAPGCGVFILFSHAKYEVVEGPETLVGTEIEVMIPCAEMGGLDYWREPGDLESFKPGELHDLILSKTNFLAPQVNLMDANPAWFYLRAAFRHR